MTGTIYILHFSRPYKHARHYVGWTQNPPKRFDRHRAGRGSPLVKAAIAEGITFEAIVLKRGDRNEERRLKRRGGASRYCPLCRKA